MYEDSSLDLSFLHPELQVFVLFHFFIKLKNGLCAFSKAEPIYFSFFLLNPTCCENGKVIIYPFKHRFMN